MSPKFKYKLNPINFDSCNTILSIPGYSKAYGTQLGSQTHDVLPIAATEIIVHGHRTSWKANFSFLKISVAAIGNTSLVWDPSWVSYASEQPKMLGNYDYMITNVMYNLRVHPL